MGKRGASRRAPTTCPSCSCVAPHLKVLKARLPPKPYQPRPSVGMALAIGQRPRPFATNDLKVPQALLVAGTARHQEASLHGVGLTEAKGQAASVTRTTSNPQHSSSGRYGPMKRQSLFIRPWPKAKG